MMYFVHYLIFRLVDLLQVPGFYLCTTPGDEIDDSHLPTLSPTGGKIDDSHLPIDNSGLPNVEVPFVNLPVDMVSYNGTTYINVTV